jgi:hypothetical protein
LDADERVSEVDAHVDGTRQLAGMLVRRPWEEIREVLAVSSVFTAGLIDLGDPFSNMVASLMAMVGLGGLLNGLWIAWRSSQSERWPTTVGTIERLELERRSVDGVDYQINCRYVYSVDGSEFKNTRIAFGYGPNGDLDGSEKLARRLKDQATVVVRYHPKNPAISCLYSNLRGTKWGTLIFMTIWLASLIGFVNLWLYIRAHQA